ILHRHGSHMPTVTVHFYWRHSHQAFWYARKPVFMDISSCFPSYGAAYDPELLFVKSIQKSYPCTGQGILVPKSMFLEHYIDGRPFPQTQVPKHRDYLEEIINEVVAQELDMRQKRSEEAKRKAYHQDSYWP